MTGARLSPKISEAAEAGKIQTFKTAPKRRVPLSAMLGRMDVGLPNNYAASALHLS